MRAESKYDYYECWTFVGSYIRNYLKKMRDLIVEFVHKVYRKTFLPNLYIVLIFPLVRNSSKPFPVSNHISDIFGQQMMSVVNLTQQVYFSFP